MARKRVSVCFVCLGNICRSPTADGVFHKLIQVAGLESQVFIDSAGTAAYHAGEEADRRSRQVAKTRGYRLDSIARQFLAEDFERFDYVLAMDQQNLRDLEELRRVTSEEVRGHLGLFRDFDASAGSGAGVPDPYYGGEGGFEEVLDQCERACEGLIEHLMQHELAPRPTQG